MNLTLLSFKGGEAGGLFSNLFSFFSSIYHYFTSLGLTTNQTYLVIGIIVAISLLFLFEFLRTLTKIVIILLVILIIVSIVGLI